MTLLRGDWFYVLLVALDAFFMARPYVYAIQQDNYRVGEIFKSRRLAFVYLFDIVAASVFTAIWLAFYFFDSRAFWGFLTVLFFFIAEFAMYFMEDLPKRKKPLKYTKRAVRCLLFVTACATAAVTCAFGVATATLKQGYLRYLVLFCFPLTFPVIFSISAGVINVFERLNNFRYMRRASKKLRDMPQLIKIAVTGSFGKTSVKNFLAAMLSKKYNVLATPASYNTPMGICKTVQSLDETYDVFIAEFGARRTGDIRALMRMVRPDHAILTGINSQHLETFGSEENIAREKCRVLEVGINGVCVINRRVRDRAEQALEKLKYRPLTIYAGTENADCVAENVAMSEDGSSFDITLGGTAYPVATSLIGRQNIENIALAAAMAYALGVEVPLILAAIEELEPVPHRMQLIRGGGILIIDDSFNSNPDGAACALETLSMFARRKVVITPGLVELGGKEREENYRLGQEIARVADLLLLVGIKRTDPIRRGATDAGFAGEIHIYESLAGAQEDFSNRLCAGDVLLILNDLPDIYDDRDRRLRKF